MDESRFNFLFNLKLLLNIDRIGPGKIFSLLSKFHSFENILAQSFNSLVKVEGVNVTLAKKIKSIGTIKEQVSNSFITELEKLHTMKARVLTYWDDAYPSLLRKIYYPPLLLYTLGNYSEMDNYSIAVVGTRQPTDYGKLQAERLTAELAKKELTIVSGLARGIDSIAHAAALKAGGRTIAVIGSGLDVIYPPENRRLFSRIKEEGLIISEFPLGTKPDAPNFPKRNRIISGLSLGTIVIETKQSGGALQTAAHALEQNREVFAVPGNLQSVQSEGTNLLIQKGEAKLITSSQDVLDELEIKLKPIVKNKSTVKVGELNLFEQSVVEVLTNKPAHIDNIAQSVSMSTSECLVQLLSLEFKGLVKQLPGKMFASTD